MRLKTLTIQNFMSVRKAVIELDQQGLLLLNGLNNDSSAFKSNGAGKSTIFEALTVAIYEKSARGLSMTEVINETVGKNMSIFLDFEGDNGKKYRISRYRKHREHKNNTLIFQDGTNITPKSNKDANQFIEDLFQMDYLTFTNAIMFGQGMIKKFSMASDSEKKDILEKMLNLNIWSEAQILAKSKLKDVNSKLSKVETTVENSTGIIDEIDSTIESLKLSEKEEKKRVKEELKELKRELELETALAEEAIEKAQETLEDAIEELKSHSSDSEEAVESLEKFQGLSKSLMKKIDKFTELEDLKLSTINEVKSQEHRKKSNSREIKELEEELQDIKNGVGAGCPVCGQKITKDSIEKSIGHVNKKIISLKEANEKIEEDVEESNSMLEDIEKSLKKKKKFEQQKEVLQGEISDLKASIRSEERLETSLKQGVKKSSERLAILEERKDVKRILKDIEKKKAAGGKTFTDLIEKKNEQKTSLLADIEKLVLTRSTLQVKQKHLEFAVDAFGNGGIKSYLLDNITPFLNEKANYYLGKLSGNTTEIEFSTQTRLASGELRDKFEVRILNSVGGGSYKSNSEGERKRIDLAISLALQDLVMTRSNARLNVLLYDEIFDALDDIGCEISIQLLTEVQERVPSIFVITHNEILKAFFENIVTVVKEGGETTFLKE